MDKNLKNRFKQLIGESIAEDKQPLLSSANVTDEKVADQLSEIEAKKKETLTLAEAESKELSEGWDEEEVVSENQEECGYCNGKGTQPSEVEGEEEDCGYCNGTGDQEKTLNESEDTVYDLPFLNEEK